MGRRVLPAAVVLYGVSVLLAAWWLPERVPLHFGAYGTADRYGSRAEALLLFALLGVVLLAALAGSRWLVRRGALGLVNVPHREYWRSPEREPELRRRLRVDLDQVFGATFLLCTALVVSLSWAARGGSDDRLPWVFVAALVTYLVWTAWWGWNVAVRRYLPPR